MHGARILPWLEISFVVDITSSSPKSCSHPLVPALWPTNPLREVIPDIVDRRRSRKLDETKIHEPSTITMSVFHLLPPPINIHPAHVFGKSTNAPSYMKSSPSNPSMRKRKRLKRHPSIFHDARPHGPDLGPKPTLIRG